MTQDHITAEEYRQTAKRSKYGNRRTRGKDSAKEANRGDELALLEKAGEISGLRPQVEFSLSVNGEHVCVYVADYVYIRDGRRVVEDVKGVRTAVYMLKKRLMRACLGIDIVEV